jgi:AraC-like DNA-binding protein
MLLQDFAPNPALTEYIRFYRLVRFFFSDSDIIPFKPYPPRPEHCLTFYPRDTETIEYLNHPTKISNIRSALVGQHSIVTNHHISKDFLVIQVIFQPGALFRLTGIPSDELTNTSLDAEAIFAKDIREVNARLNSIDNHLEMIQIIETFIHQLITKNKKDYHAVDRIGNLMLQNVENTSLDWLAKESCLSTKQFERKFNERLGINPKYFARIVRFDKAVRMRNRYPNLDWLSIAIDCGYYDYQHLAKAYKEFTGHSPIAFHYLDTPEKKFGLSDF